MSQKNLNKTIEIELSHPSLVRDGLDPGNQSTPRVPGLGQITWRIVLTKKMMGHLEKKSHGNREIVPVSAVEVRVHKDS